MRERSLLNAHRVGAPQWTLRPGAHGRLRRRGGHRARARARAQQHRHECNHGRGARRAGADAQAAPSSAAPAHARRRGDTGRGRRDACLQPRRDRAWIELWRLARGSSPSRARGSSSDRTAHPPPRGCPLCRRRVAARFHQPASSRCSGAAKAARRAAFRRSQGAHGAQCAAPRLRRSSWPRLSLAREPQTATHTS